MKLKLQQSGMDLGEAFDIYGQSALDMGNVDEVEPARTARAPRTARLDESQAKVQTELDLRTMIQTSLMS